MFGFAVARFSWPPDRNGGQVGDPQHGGVRMSEGDLVGAGDLPGCGRCFRAGKGVGLGESVE